MIPELQRLRDKGFKKLNEITEIEGRNRGVLRAEERLEHNTSAYTGGVELDT
jgi:hypothetical protein